MLHITFLVYKIYKWATAFRYKLGLYHTQKKTHKTIYTELEEEKTKMFISKNK